MTSSFRATVRSPRARLLVLAAYYVVVQLALLALYARADFSAPPYIYQGF